MAKKTPIQKAQDGLSGRATHRRIASLDASMARKPKPKPKPKAKPKVKVVIKPKKKFVDQRAAKIKAQQLADRKAIAAMKKKKKTT